LSDQVVLITGALTGIGRATAIAFAREGARIVVSGRHDKEEQKLVIELHNLSAVRAGRYPDDPFGVEQPYAPW